MLILQYLLLCFCFSAYRIIYSKVLLSQQEYSAFMAFGGLTNYKIIYPRKSSEDAVSFNIVYKLTYTYSDFKTSVTEKFYSMIQFE